MIAYRNSTRRAIGSMVFDYHDPIPVLERRQDIARTTDTSSRKAPPGEPERIEHHLGQGRVWWWIASGNNGRRRVGAPISACGSEVALSEDMPVRLRVDRDGNRQSWLLLRCRSCRELYERTAYAFNRGAGFCECQVTKPRDNQIALAPADKSFPIFHDYRSRRSA